jgi:hypothetical protein
MLFLNKIIPDKIAVKIYFYNSAGMNSGAIVKSLVIRIHSGAIVKSLVIRIHSGAIVKSLVIRIHSGAMGGLI